MKWLVSVLLLATTGAAFAHQPVMDMAPRWDGGYGFQVRVENFNSQTTTWLEGVYTFDKSIRATFKLPNQDGQFGDLIVGLPLKKYSNDGARTSNWSVTPSVRVPTSAQGEWDAGLSLSYSSESPKYYQLYDLYSWGDITGLDVNVGMSFPGKGSGKFLMWDVSLLTSDLGDRVLSGPVFVYFRKNMMFRVEYKALVYERDSDWSGGYANIGIGFVY